MQRRAAICIFAGREVGALVEHRHHVCQVAISGRIMDLAAEYMVAPAQRENQDEDEAGVLKV